MAADFPIISCTCNITEYAEEWGEFATAISRFKTGGSSRLLLSNIAHGEIITLKLEALSAIDYKRIKDHYYNEARGISEAFKINLNHYVSNVPGGIVLSTTVRNKGLWRYNQKPQTPAPQPEGYYIDLEFISEET